MAEFISRSRSQELKLAGDSSDQRNRKTPAPLALLNYSVTLPDCNVQ